MSAGESKASFFRQSGWMALATMAGGVGNMLTMFIAQRMPSGEFNTFDIAVSALGVLGIPAAGLQLAFAQQAAAADSPERQRELRATFQWAAGGFLLLWLALTAFAVVAQPAAMASLNLRNPGVFWLLLPLWLATLLVPIPMGVLQGRQNFAWFGWATFLSGAVRCLVVTVLVLGLHVGAEGAVGGVLAGTAAVLFLATWPNRDCLVRSHATVDWQAWLRRLLPVMVATGASSFMSQADVLIGLKQLRQFDLTLSPDALDGFSAVRRIGLAMIFLIGGVTTVMFPKIARSSRRAEKSNALVLSLGLTLGIGVGGATLATLFPELPLVISPERLQGSKTLVPLYCWAQVPMALASILVWNLVAREAYAGVWVLAAVAGGYVLALRHWHASLVMLIQVLFVFAVLFLVVGAVFSWLASRRSVTADVSRR